MLFSLDKYSLQKMLEQVIFGLMIYREAMGEPREGKIAVAQTVMNRAHHPKWWGRTPYEVIVRAKQYTSMTYLGDPMTIRFPPHLDDLVLLECIDIAGEVLAGKLPHPAPGADSYFSTTMKIPPKWADESKFVRQIGHHRFYNLDGDPSGTEVA